MTPDLVQSGLQGLADRARAERGFWGVYWEDYILWWNDYKLTHYEEIDISPR